MTLASEIPFPVHGVGNGVHTPIGPDDPDEDYYEAEYEPPPFTSTVMQLEPDLPSLWIALTDAEDVIGTDPAPTLHCRDLLAVVEHQLEFVHSALDTEIEQWGLPPADTLEEMERFGDGHHYPTVELDVACGVLDDIERELDDCRVRLAELLGALNRAQRRGAQARIDAAFDAIMAGEIWTAFAITAEIQRTAIGALELPEPAPMVHPVDLPRPDAERSVDALVAAAAAPPR